MERRGRWFERHQVQRAAEAGGDAADVALVAFDQRELLTHEWFTAIPQGSRKSPLQRFFESFTDLSDAGAPAEHATALA